VKLKYSWIIFDADGTLFDYVHAETEALRRSMLSAGLHYSEGVLRRYQKINIELWKAYERGGIQQEVLRTERFAVLFDELGMTAVPEEFSELYLQQLALFGYLLDGAEDVVATLAAEVPLLLLTNGIGPVQRSRLAHSPLRERFQHVLISSEIGAAKPSPLIFNAALERMGNPDPAEVLMVGDNFAADIAGAQQCGMDTCWMNPQNGTAPAGEAPTYEIRFLRDLLPLLQD